ncbi:MAG: NosD domain-containing protein [Litoreibacter sp.]|uniref:NosD domain-containing protein n=1 Tax=Litoreibacter sp. TaxID=1969459 RepID=UPI003297EB95
MDDYEELRTQLFDVYTGLSEQSATLQHPSRVDHLVAGLFDQNDEHTFEAELPRASTGAADIELIDLRLVLLQLSFAAGSNDQLSIVRAQSTSTPQAIVINDGQVNLDELRAWVSAQPDPNKLLNNDTLHVPLVVFQNGRFDMTSGDQLELSTKDGAFIANLGVLVMDDAAISATADTNETAEQFVPFVATAGIGQAQISNSVFERLGFGDTALYSGVSIINRGLYAPIGQSYLTDTVLRDVQGATFAGGTSPIIKSNVFVGEAAGGLILRSTNNALISSNVFLGGAAGAALKFMSGATNNTVLRNIIFSASGPGIFVTEGSHETTIMDNIIWKSGSGISVMHSDCVDLTGNVAVDNLRKGIELRTSRNSRIVANQMLGNHSSGLFIGAQPSGTTTWLNDNLFIGNRVGLSSASSDHLVLNQNDFRNQFPRFLDGDLASQTSRIVTNLRGTDAIELRAGGIELFNITRLACLTQLEG